MSLSCFPAVLAAAETDPARPWTWAFVAITFALYLYIGWRSRVKETAGFYVAGQGVPAIANGAATAADWMSAASFIGMAGLISFSGSDGAVYLMGWTGGFVLLDTQMTTPHLERFGVVEISRMEYERRLEVALRVDATWDAISDDPLS